MANDEKLESYRQTIEVCKSSLFATGLLWFFWIPKAASASKEHEFRPMLMGPILLTSLIIGAVPGIFTGLYQRCYGPTKYGVVSLCFSTLPLVAFQITAWLLLDLRGIRFAD